MSKSIALPSMYVMTTHLHHMQNLTAYVDATLRLASSACGELISLQYL